MPIPFMSPPSSNTTDQARLAVRYIDDYVLLSADAAWTYVRLPDTHYDFLDNSQLVAAASRFTIALTALIGKDPIDCHLLVTHRPIPTELWAQALHTRVSRYQYAPGWSTWLHNVTDHLDRSGFTRRDVYLGVKLGHRGQDLTGAVNGFLAPLTKLLRKAESPLGLTDEDIKPDEITKWRQKAATVRRTLTESHIKATPTTADTLAWLISRPLWPAMECPPPSSVARSKWGPGDLTSLTEGIIDNGYRTLKVEQPNPDGGTWTGYTATLCAARFPDTLTFPTQEPWALYATSLDFPVDVSMRFTLVPPRTVHSDVKRKLADAKDQAAHIAEAGLVVPMKVQETLDAASHLEYSVEKNRTPWVYGRYRFTITGATQDEVNAHAQRLQEHYRDLGIDMIWPTGDQFDLLLEAIPGEKVRAKSYLQRQEAIMIAGGMPHASTIVGDRIDEHGKGWTGPYLGYTTHRQLHPVFFSPHVAMTRNASPGTAVLGSPGGGKSFLAFTLAAQMALQGNWVIYIDPKADAIPMASLPGLGNAQLFDLRHGQDGMLDPFSLGDSPAAGKLLALETARLLLGGHLSEEREEAFAQALDYVASRPNPSLAAVVDVLERHETTAGRNLATVLRTIRDMPFARLCFAPSGGAKLDPRRGLTIVTLLGLSLPADGKAMHEYSYEERLGVSVMYLLTRYANELMLNLDKSHPKAICVDEAWAITATPQGKQMIPMVARMGRSHNTALVLVTQNAKDLMDEGVSNSVTTKFAFRSTNADEITNVLEFLGLEPNDINRDMIRLLRNGECLMQDVDGRVTRMKVDNWDEAAFHAFDTNPETRGTKVNIASGGAGLS